MSIVWQWVLSMQLAEFFIWKGIDDNDKKINKFGTKLALFLNILQPVVLFIVPLILLDKNISLKNKIIASCIIISYISFMLINFNQVPEYTELNPSQACSNMNLKWWEDIQYAGIIYCITLFSIIFLFVKPFQLASLISAYIFIALILSMIFYSCGQPSIWCWLVVPMPLLIASLTKQMNL
jgi:hypothetical protein